MTVHDNRFSPANEPDAFKAFTDSHPEYSQTVALDELRASDYARLDRLGHVYLDYTGGGLYGSSQIRRHLELLEDHVLGNPHSGNPTSIASTHLVEEARDAVLAFWNAPLDDPDHHVNAARAALAMQERLKALNEEMIGRGDGTWPGEVKIGIGLNSGPCCVGNIGSERRLSYSLIGDPVNLASRLEGLSKYYGVSILMGDALAKNLSEFATLPIDRVRVVGRDAAETVHVLLGDVAMGASYGFMSFEKAHLAVIEAYYAQKWALAAELNDANEQAAATFGLTKLVMLYRDRIAAFAANPPSAGWDGIYEASSK